jgi:fibronectin-binding autotransporter adhesin
MGNLYIGNNTLAVTGGSDVPTDNYTLAFSGATLSGDATFNVANNTNGTGLGFLSVGAVSGNHAVTINSGNSNPGTVIFASGGSYSGTTSINGGTLEMIGTFTGTGAVTVNAGGTLSGATTSGSSSTIRGAVTVNSSGIIAATNTDPMSLTGGLTLNSNSTSQFTLNGAPSSSALIATSGATPSLNIAGSNTINIAGTPDLVVPTGHTSQLYTYDLYSYSGSDLYQSGNGTTGLSYTNGSLSLGTTASGPFIYSLTDTGSQVDLNVTTYAITWAGSASSNNTWDTTTQNWQYNNGSVVTTNFVNGATTIFADLPNNTGTATVNVQTAGVNPGNITFTTTGAGAGGTDYVFIGGPIGGSASVLMSGGGNVTFNSTNTYTGTTTIDAGTLIAGVPTALGTSAVTLNGGTLRLGAEGYYSNAVNVPGNSSQTLDVAATSTAATFSIASLSVGSGGPATLNVTAATATGNQPYALTTGPVTLNSNTTFKVNNVGTGVGNLILGTVSGGSNTITAAGPGNVTLIASNNTYGGTTVTGGTLAAGYASSPLGSGQVTLNGGNLSLVGNAGLLGQYYGPDPNGASGGSDAPDFAGLDPNIHTLANVQSFVGSQVPVLMSPTTTGGLTSLTFTNSATGAVFASQGFPGGNYIQAIFTGDINIQSAGSYTFKTTSDDGSTLFIDGNLVVDNDNNHSVTTVTGSPITLSAGLHAVVIGYYNGQFGSDLAVGYQGPDTGNTMESIPDSVLSDGLNASTQTYSNNITLQQSATISVSGSLAATVGTLTIPSGATLSVNSSDTSGNAYSLTFSGSSVNVSGTVGFNVDNSTSGGTGTVNIGSLVTTGATPILNVNATAGNTGTLQSSAAPILANHTSLMVNAGTLAFSVNSGSATIGTNVSATVASGAVLQLSGTVSALSSSANTASVNNNGMLSVVGTSNQTVGNVVGTSGTDVNGATIYAGSTVVGDGTNSANLTANEVLQNAIVVNNGSSLTIVPSASGGSVAMSDASSSGVTHSAAVTSAASSSGSSGGDAFASIEAALSVSSTQNGAVTTLRDLVGSNSDWRMSRADAVELFQNYELANGGSLGSNVTPVSSPSLAVDLAADGLSSSEIADLGVTGSSGSFSGGIGSLSPAVSVGGDTAAVPEPSTLVLAALGLGAMGFGLRRRNIAQKRLLAD